MRQAIAYTRCKSVRHEFTRVIWLDIYSLPFRKISTNLLQIFSSAMKFRNSTLSTLFSHFWCSGHADLSMQQASFQAILIALIFCSLHLFRTSISPNSLMFPHSSFSPHLRATVVSQTRDYYACQDPTKKWFVPVGAGFEPRTLISRRSDHYTTCHSLLISTYLL